MSRTRLKTIVWLQHTSPTLLDGLPTGSGGAHSYALEPKVSCSEVMRAAFAYFTNGLRVMLPFVT